MKALEDIRIADFSRFGAGPIGPMMLANMGAEVISIEKPGGEDDRELPPFTPGNYSLLAGACRYHKKCITLNLLSEKGQELMAELVKRTDIVVHNFTPRTRQANMLSYDRLIRINPAIILVEVSAFGQDGPYAERTGFDSIGQGMSGAMSITGFPGNPPTRSGVPWVDWITATNVALGAMVALHHRERTGQGQRVEVSLLDSAFFVSGSMTAGEYQLYNRVRPQLGNQSYLNPTNSFKAKDGWVQIGPPTMAIWRRFVKAIGSKELNDDSRFPDVEAIYQNRDFVNPIISEWVNKRTIAEVVKVMDENRVPCAPILTLDKVFTDSHVKARKMLVDIEYPDGLRVQQPEMPIRMSLTPCNAEGRLSEVEEYNEEIYCGLLGYSLEELSQWKGQGVI